MGDVTSDVQKKLRLEGMMGLLPAGVDITSVDLLKVSHHGAANGTSEEFLSYIQADKALISCGENNAYGHPAPTTLTLLEEHVNAVYRTDTQGTVLFTWDKASACSVEKGR